MVFQEELLKNNAALGKCNGSVDRGTEEVRKADAEKIALELLDKVGMSEKR